MLKLTLRINGDGFHAAFDSEQNLAEFMAKLTALIATHGSIPTMAALKSADSIRALIPAAPSRPNGFTIA